MDLDRYLEVLIAGEIPQPKEIVAEIPGPTSDELADALDDAADEIGSPRFAISDDSLLAFATIRGNPWDLHDVLESLSALSLKFPELTFGVALDGERGELRAGAYTGVPFDTIAAWAAEYPRPHCATTDLCATLECSGAIDRVREELGRWGHLGFELSDHGDTLSVTISRPDRIAFVVAQALGALWLEPEPWRAELELAGELAWRCTIDDLPGALALETLLPTLLADAPNSAEPEPEPAFEPAPSLEIARLAQPELLALEPSSQRRLVLGDDGVFRPVQVTPPGARRALGPGVEVEVAFQLGRIRHRIVAGERTSRAFVNSSAMARDGARVLLTAERDGQSELLALDLATFAETRICAAPDRPSELFVQAGEILGVVHDRNQTRVVRYPDGVVRTRVPGSLEHCWRDGDALIVTTDHRDSNETRLHRIALADGTTRSAALGAGRTAVCSCAGPWLAWQGRDAATVRVLERLEPRNERALAAGLEVYDLAISATGALAIVLAAGDSTLLEVTRGAVVARHRLPAPCAVAWC